MSHLGSCVKAIKLVGNYLIDYDHVQHIQKLTASIPATVNGGRPTEPSELRPTCENMMLASSAAPSM